MYLFRLTIVALSALLATPAGAFWISDNPNYRTAKGTHCSGPEHCKPVPGRAYFSAAGWRVKGMEGALPTAQVYPSIDGQPWACMWGGDQRAMRGGRLQCLFLPEDGG